MVGHDVEHRLEVEASRADGLEHVGHRGLAFEGRVEVVEQLSVADGQRGLRCEGRQSFEFDLRERLHFVPEHVESPDVLVAIPQWDERVAADVSRRRHFREVRAPTVGDGHHVVEVHDAMVGGDDVRSIDAGSSERGAEVRLHGGSVRRHESFLVAFDQRDRTGFTATQFGGRVEDALQHRVAFARVFADQSQHFRRRRLEFQRFGEVGVALVDVGDESRVRDCVAGLDGEGLQEFDLVGGERMAPGAMRRSRVVAHRRATVRTPPP